MEEHDKGALRRMDNEFENSKKEQIMSFLRDQSKFNRCISNSSEDDADDTHLISSITNTHPRLPLHSISRPKTASVSRKFQGDVQSCKSKISQRPMSGYGCRRPHQLKLSLQENEYDSKKFRKRANTTEMSRIDEVDAASNASTRSVTPDLEDVDDSVFISPLSPKGRHVHGMTSPTQSHIKPECIRRYVSSSNSNDPKPKLKPIKDDLKQWTSGSKGKRFTENNNDSSKTSSRKKNITNSDGEVGLVAERTSQSEIMSTFDDSVSTSVVRKHRPRSSYGNGPHDVVAIDPLPIDATTIGVQGIARVECDASLYKQMRNKSAPNLRHTEAIREPYNVYHLPPLEKTRPDGIHSSDVIPSAAQVADLIRL